MIKYKGNLKKKIQLNNDKNTTYYNLWNAVKVPLSEKFRALYGYMRQ